MVPSFLVLAAALPGAAAFSTAPAIGPRRSTALRASRNKQKSVSRTQWAAARGYGAASTATAAPPAGLLKNDAGLEYVRLSNADGDTADVYLYGGVVTSYVAGGREVLAVRKDITLDGSRPISGGLAHCWPQFGPGALQLHGFARNVYWKVRASTDASVELELAPSAYTREMWDEEFRCTFSVALGDDRLATKLVVENRGEDPFDFSAALHSYFAVSDIGNLSVAGSFKGREYENRIVGKEATVTEDREEITIGEWYDRIYKGVNDPVVKDAGTSKSVTIRNAAGWEDTVIWNPYGDEKVGYDKFVCVESVKANPVTLEGGALWTGEMSLLPGDF